MVSKETEILEGSFIRIAPRSELIGLGYDLSDPDFIKYADKVFQVKAVQWIDEDLRYVYVHESDCCFIDADIEAVLSA